jgi:hypothetical protein
VIVLTTSDSAERRLGEYGISAAARLTRLEQVEELDEVLHSAEDATTLTLVRVPR